MSKNLVLISTNPLDVELFQDVATRVGWSFLNQTSWEQFTVLPPDSLVLWDIESLEALSPQEMDTHLKPVTALPFNHANLVTLSKTLLSERPKTWQCLLNQRIIPKTHFTVRGSEHSAELFTTFLHWMIRPLEIPKTFTSAEKAFQLCFEHSGQRSEGCSKVQKYFQDLGVGSRVASKIAQGTDELLMNAIYDAAGTEARRQLTKDHTVHFPPNKRIQLNALATDRLLVVHVRDFHGTLNDLSALTHIHQHLKEGIYEINTDLPTAGLGLFELARTGISIFLSCRPGQFTDALIALPRLDSLKYLRKESQFVHSFTHA